MAQSPEYPDLAWVEPRSWTNANRTSVQLVVIHTTEGSAHGQSAEDGAAYDARRTDGTSTHYFHDSTSTVQCVRTADQAHTARAQGNRRGIHHELCTRAGSANWSDTYHQAMLRRAAKQAARDAKKWNIPIRHLTVAQVDAGAKGFCGHRDVTFAFPEDGGTHTDPGPNFPWTQFLTMVRDELEDEDMPTTREIVDALLNEPLTMANGSKKKVRDVLAWQDAVEVKTRTAILAAIAKDDDVDEAALVAALAPAVAAQVIAALPQGADQISQDEVTTAVKTALRDAFAG